jgi:hypothetical protein
VGPDLRVEFLPTWLRVIQTDLAGEFKQLNDDVGFGTGAAGLR